MVSIRPLGIIELLTHKKGEMRPAKSALSVWGCSETNHSFRKYRNVRTAQSTIHSCKASQLWLIAITHHDIFTVSSTLLPALRKTRRKELTARSTPGLSIASLLADPPLHSYMCGRTVHPLSNPLCSVQSSGCRSWTRSCDFHSAQKGRPG
jgi:hypothetical protein